MHQKSNLSHKEAWCKTYLQLNKQYNRNKSGMRPIPNTPTGSLEPSFLQAYCHHKKIMQLIDLLQQLSWQ